jgi:hypothetical protein
MTEVSLRLQLSYSPTSTAYNVTFSARPSGDGVAGAAMEQMESHVAGAQPSDADVRSGHAAGNNLSGSQGN